MHCLALRIGVKPRCRYTDPGLLVKPCTLVHLQSRSGYTFQTDNEFTPSASEPGQALKRHVMNAWSMKMDYYRGRHFSAQRQSM